MFPSKHFQAMHATSYIQTRCYIFSNTVRYFSGPNSRAQKNQCVQKRFCRTYQGGRYTTSCLYSRCG